MLYYIILYYIILCIAVTITISCLLISIILLLLLIIISGCSAESVGHRDDTDSESDHEAVRRAADSRSAAVFQVSVLQTEILRVEISGGAACILKDFTL